MNSIRNMIAATLALLATVTTAGLIFASFPVAIPPSLATTLSAERAPVAMPVAARVPHS